MSANSNLPGGGAAGLSDRVKNKESVERRSLDICESFEFEEGIDGFIEDYYQLTVYLVGQIGEEKVAELYTDLGSAIGEFSNLYQFFLYPVNRISPVADLAMKLHGSSAADSSALNRELLKFMLGENFDIKQLLEASLQLENKWSAFVVDNEKLADRFICEQKRYGEFMQKGTELAAVGANIYNWDFYSVIFFVARWRGMMALVFEHKEPLSIDEAAKYLEEPMDTQMGEIRGFEGFAASVLTNTPCSETGAYADIAAYIQERLRKDPEDICDIMRIYPERCDDMKVCCCSQKIMDFTELELERFYHNPQAADELLKTYITHTSPENIPALLILAKKQYDWALIERRPENTLKLLGEVFWLLCRAKPFRRGNSSIAEMLVKSVWYRKYGQHLPSWREGVIPWAAAIKERDSQLFGENFLFLFNLDQGVII